MEETQLTEGMEVSTTFEDIEAAEIKLMTAITRDPNPIHFDRKVIEKMGFPGLVNQGASNLSYLVQGVEGLTDEQARIRDVDVRFESQVFEGDTLTTNVVVEAVQERTDGLDVETSAEVVKPDGTVVMTGTANLQLPDR
jgi:acyl dehydratase